MGTDTSLGGLKIKTLREKTDNEEAQILSKWLIGAFCHKRLGVVCRATQWTQPLILLPLLQYPDVLLTAPQITSCYFFQASDVDEETRHHVLRNQSCDYDSIEFLGPLGPLVLALYVCKSVSM